MSIESIVSSIAIACLNTACFPPTFSWTDRIGESGNVFEARLVENPVHLNFLVLYLSATTLFSMKAVCYFTARICQRSVCFDVHRQRHVPVPTARYYTIVGPLCAVSMSCRLNLF